MSLLAPCWLDKLRTFHLPRSLLPCAYRTPRHPPWCPLSAASCSTWSFRCRGLPDRSSPSLQGTSTMVLYDCRFSKAMRTCRDTLLSSSRSASTAYVVCACWSPAMSASDDPTVRGTLGQVRHHAFADRLSGILVFENGLKMFWQRPYPFPHYQPSRICQIPRRDLRMKLNDGLFGELRMMGGIDILPLSVDGDVLVFHGTVDLFYGRSRRSISCR